MSGGYKVKFLSIKNDYDFQCSTDQMSNEDKLDEQIVKLDAANNHRLGPATITDWSTTLVYPVDSIVKFTDNKYYKCIVASPAGRGPYGGYVDGSAGNTQYWIQVQQQDIPNVGFDNTSEIEVAFAPIAQYYANLQSIKIRLQDFLKDTSEEVSEGQGHILNEDRYMESVYPERSMNAREISHGLLPELKSQTIPVLVSVGAAMLAFAIVVSFQMAGVTGQLSLSPAYAQGYATFKATASSITNNTSIVGGFAGVCLVIAMYFAYLYAMSPPRQ